MNLLFLTLIRIEDINERGIYTDLMREFRDRGHQVYIVSPVERKFNQSTRLQQQDGITILKVKTLNIQKTNVVEKGLGTLLLEYQYLAAIKKYLREVKFDLVIYSTPPITLTSVIRSLKKRCGAKTYLLLKDIFPQNAVDLGMFKKNGLIYHFFRRKENKLYALSDHIGCMSPANVEYLLKNNPEINPQKIEVNPNSIALSQERTRNTDKTSVRNKYSIPESASVFIYGGNLGRPQGLNFLLDVIRDNDGNSGKYFLVVGSGTEYNRMEEWFRMKNPVNAKLIPGLPKEEYDTLVEACDVGLIFLDPRFTIPNFPSRLLSYLESRMPVIAATDPVSDVGKIAEVNGFGYYVLNGDLKKMKEVTDTLTENIERRNQMGSKGFDYLKHNYLVGHSCEIIEKHLKIGS